ncbi:MAG: hypothetical protein AB1657_03745 [Candidatus Micrarchaeota archaeon]
MDGGKKGAAQQLVATDGAADGLPAVRRAGTAAAEGHAGKKANSFWARALMVAGLALIPAGNAKCMGESAHPIVEEDADAQQDVDPEADAEAHDEDAGPETDVHEEDADAREGDAAPDADVVEGRGEDAGADGDSDVADPGADGEAVEEADAETPGEDAGDAEAEASCPVSDTVLEYPEVPGPIGTSDQIIVEEYGRRVECDGTEARTLNRVDISLTPAASPEQLGDAVRQGSDTIIPGGTVRLTAAGLDGIGYARKVPGAEGRVGINGTVSNGIVTGRLIGFYESGGIIYASLGTERPGYTDRYADAPEGAYVNSQGTEGWVFMATAFDYNPADPGLSTCSLTMLEAPVNVPNGGAIAHDGGTFRLGTIASGTDLASARFRRE